MFLNRALDDGLDPNLANRFAWTLLMLAAMEGNTPIGEAPLAKGAKVNLANDFGNTPLSLAAHAGHVKFARWLPLVGASTDARPHGHDMATWIKMGSGLPKDKLAEVLTLIGHKEHLHWRAESASGHRYLGRHFLPKGRVDPICLVLWPPISAAAPEPHTNLLN